MSSLEQGEALQRDALTAAGCQRIFVDKVSGKLEYRPALDSMLEQLHPGDSVAARALVRRDNRDVYGHVSSEGARSAVDRLSAAMDGDGGTYGYTDGYISCS